MMMIFGSERKARKGNYVKTEMRYLIAISCNLQGVRWKWWNGVPRLFMFTFKDRY